VLRNREEFEKKFEKKSAAEEKYYSNKKYIQET